MTKQPNKQIKGYKGSNSFTAPFARVEYQIDILVLAPLSMNPELKITPAKKEGRYALILIDIFSKFAGVVLMNEKQQ